MLVADKLDTNNGSSLRLTVRDTGIGIPQEEIQRVFDRYYSGASGSQGIGLSLVKRICQRYGWRIGIDSSEGQGTLIRLWFASHLDRS